MPESRLLHERRREPRLRIALLVNVAPYGDAEAPVELIMGRTVDLSRSGARVELHRPIEPGTRVKLTFALGERVAAALGEVRSLTRPVPAVCELGVAFLDLGPPDREALAAFLARRRSRDVSDAAVSDAAGRRRARRAG